MINDKFHVGCLDRIFHVFILILVQLLADRCACRRL